MELTSLRYFRTIAAMRHMTRAAESLGVTQPALSAMVKKLEAEVGAPLLDRTGKGVALTEAGRVFLHHSEEALRRADAAVEAVRELAGLGQGQIRVGGGATATAYILPAAVGAVRRAHPKIKFFVREGGSSAIASAVLSGELDLGIVTMPEKGKWALPGAGDLMSIPLVEDELRLLVPHGMSIGRKGRGRERVFAWRDVASQPIVAFEAGTAVRAMIDQASATAGVTLDVVMELRSIESIKRMVDAGIGLGFVSRFALASGEGLVCAEGRLTRTLAVVRRRDRMPSPAVAAFERELLAWGRECK